MSRTMKHCDPVRLTGRQRDMKLLFCFTVAVVCVVVAVWAGMWMLAAAVHGIVSVLHVVLFLAGMLLAVVFGDITGREVR